MKKIFILLILVTAMNAKVSGDKELHLLAGAGIYGLCLITGNIMEEAGYNSYLDSTTCLIPVSLIGAGKELYDSKRDNHTAEFSDFAYTMAIPVGMSIILYKW